MKSTTLRRSNITREKVAMMEALNRYNREHQDEDFYRRQTKSRELDALWQTLGVATRTQKSERTPQVYFVMGLIVGVIITLIITTFVSLLINVATPKDDITIKPSKQVTSTDNGKFRFIPADNAKAPAAANMSNKEYTVKEGDTLENIVIRFYGKFDMDKVALIQEANKMANPNALSIGQKLIIPVSK